jgi:hypothetical protein
MFGCRSFLSDCTCLMQATFSGGGPVDFLRSLDAITSRRAMQSSHEKYLRFIRLMATCE